ncbi:MAG TPA: hypothetical protein VE980_07770 [Pyrinomonadaceae bacterium]|nr:hypothetical protein [Pyrinomonadaceae bacterium]
MKRLLLLIATITLIGCARPGDHPVSQDCVWSEQDSHSWDRRHLRFDAVTAEDMSIRWADMHFGLRPEWNQKQAECMQTLFQGIAEHHGIDVATVHQYSLDRDPIVDGVVIFSFGVLYLFVAYIFAGRIRRRFHDDDTGFWIMTLTMAAGVSLVAVMVGMLGSIVIEEYRLNTVHLSYRMNRIPFRQHWAMLFACGFVVFGLVALLRSRIKFRKARLFGDANEF